MKKVKRAFANSFEFDPAKPLVMPYGRYPHKKAKGVQVVDARSAVAFETDISRAIAAGAPGIPIYVGHPDVPDLAPKYPDKGAKGWATSVEAGEEECRFAVAWCEEPKPGAFIYFSPWLAGDDEPNGDVLIDELRSIGLTNRPNTTRFRLPNEVEEDSTPTPPEGNTMKKVLNLLGLAETATEDEAAAALQTLLDQITALTRKSEEATAEVALANTARDEAKTGFANERDAHIGLLLDCGLRDGKVTPATRPVWAGRLRTDFANESAALARECAKLKTRSVLPNELDAQPGNILARYDAMPKGAEKSAFLRQNAVAINAARNARG